MIPLLGLFSLYRMPLNVEGYITVWKRKKEKKCTVERAGNEGHRNARNRCYLGEEGK